MHFLERFNFWKKTAIATVVAMFLLPLCAFAQEQNTLQLYEQKIKAGLIYNFLKYTEWPVIKKAPAPIVVCIYGAEDPFDGYLQPIEDRTVNQRQINMRHVSGREELSVCNLLFVNSSEQAGWPALRDYLANKSILTVGDFPGFSNSGGMIEFDTRNNRVQIELNLQAITAANLHVYDSLRRLAKTTHSSGGAE